MTPDPLIPWLLTSAVCKFGEVGRISVVPPRISSPPRILFLLSYCRYILYCDNFLLDLRKSYTEI